MWTLLVSLALARTINVKTFEADYQPQTLECRGGAIKADDQLVVGAKRFDWLDAALKSAPPEAGVGDIHLEARKKVSKQFGAGSLVTAGGVLLMTPAVLLVSVPLVVVGAGVAVTGLVIELVALAKAPPGREVRDACVAYTAWRATSAP